MKIPHVEVGDVVLHFERANENCVAVPAIITEVGEHSVHLAILAPGMYNFSVRNGVRHKTDPDLKKHNEEGCWDLREREKTLNSIIADLAPRPEKTAKK